jgi:hypothetical protein
MRVKRTITTLAATITMILGGVAVASPAYATDGNLYNCAPDLYDSYYCTWSVSPHVNYPTNWKINVYNMADCRWYYVPDSQYGYTKSQANTSGYWLEAFNGYDSSTAIVYSHTGPNAMTQHWWTLSAIRRIPGGKTHC